MKSGAFFSSPLWKRRFSRSTHSPSLHAATFALASSPTTSLANVTLPPSSSLSRAATGASDSFLTSFFAFSSASSVAFACSASGRAAIFAFSFLFSSTFASNTLCGLPICEQRITFAPCSIRYWMVGSAPTIRFSSVMTPSFMGTLKSHLTRTFLPLTSTSFTVFLFIKKRSP